MKIKALVPFSTGTISMEQYEVKEVTDTIGNELISSGVAVEIGGGSGGGVLVVTDTEGTLDKTWQEIHDADFAVVVMSSDAVTRRDPVIYTNSSHGYQVQTGYAEEGYVYVAESASGYPTLSE